ncbi:VOC family protein [Flavihumibacter solisilvae]|uniref:Glyoxalase n=1 Tax=Flavihumibacter solisilvae TaxID=1349421 RepID=A0A0C1IP55_9BACT|nr:VOC family protein [Flavihumibacter solisilvae]KIC95985.1 glyoxalase [Flavihumibacter solisilvae]
MKIEHIALWTYRLEEMKAFYEKYFNAVSNDLYHNRKKGFRSFFLSFGDGARLELMQMEGIPLNRNSTIEQYTGLIHFAISVKSREEVDSLTARLKADGFPLVDGPRQTGDGYYESVILDPDGNRIEITA